MHTKYACIPDTFDIMITEKEIAFVLLNYYHESDTNKPAWNVILLWG